MQYHKIDVLSNDKNELVDMKIKLIKSRLEQTPFNRKNPCPKLETNQI